MSFARRTVLAVITAAAAFSGSARADFVCKPLDVPGSTWTQLWQVNSAGEVAAGSDVGGRTYSGGAWLPLPAPPASSGYGITDLNALGINDSGVIAGVANNPATGNNQGFILSGPSYSFLSYQPGSYSNTEVRAISSSGIVTGWAYDSVNLIGPAFVYNPAGAPGYAPGFTEIVPTLPDGTRAFFSIPGAMNATGQFVGSTNFTGHDRYGFLYDPAKSSPVSLFQVSGRSTAARGINDRGYVVGFTRDAAGATTGFLLTDAGYQLIACPELAASSLFPESINNSGVVSGSSLDAAGNFHGFIAYPNVVLPVASVNGAFVFDVAVSPNTPVFLDPVTAVGYLYTVGSRQDPSFASVTLPIGIGDNIYTVVTPGKAFKLAGGQKLDFTRSGFAAGVRAFAVLGIPASAGLDPANPTAFVTEVTFGGGGRFTGSMRPLALPSELLNVAQRVLAAALR